MTEQSNEWGSGFGDDYVNRNPGTPDEMEQLYVARFGMPRTQMNATFLGDLPRDIRILEVGSNVGTQLGLLARMGFENLYGVEINETAIERSHSVTAGQPIWVVKGSALDIPFKDGWFDLVYTSGVLIHIHPNDLMQVIDEMYRCSSRYIWGFEYYTPEGYPEIPYRGRSNMLWKTDFAARFVERKPDLATLREAVFPYLDEVGLEDKMYLLRKD